MDNKPPDNELDRLIKLHDAAIELNTVSTREGLLRVACTQFVSIFNAAGCALSIWNRENDTVHTIADYWGESNDTNFEMSGQFPLKDYPLTRKVLETSQYLYLSVTDEKIDPNEIELLKSFDVHSMLMLPLQNG